MKCKRCKKEAIIALPSHNTGFCPDCFEHFFTQQVLRGIDNQKMCTHDDRILVALSGGKDSLSLMHILSKLGYDVTGLHIDLSIGTSSSTTRALVERFCSQHNFKLIVHEVAKDGLAIPDVKKVITRPICSACGKIKRYFFNKIAVEGGYTALATGHNLDDEVARLFSNTLRWDVSYLADQAPFLPAESGFAKRIKPLWRLSEFEIGNFAFLQGIEHHYAPCPYSQGATHTFYKHIWHELEEAMPSRKLAFYVHFLENAKEAFVNAYYKDNRPLAPCSQCQMPTSAGICGVCRLKEAVKQGPTDKSGSAGKRARRARCAKRASAVEHDAPPAHDSPPGHDAENTSLDDNNKHSSKELS